MVSPGPRSLQRSKEQLEADLSSARRITDVVDRAPLIRAYIEQITPRASGSKRFPGERWAAPVPVDHHPDARQSPNNSPRHPTEFWRPECQDFELLLVVHSPQEQAVAGVQALVGEFPAVLRKRITVMSCTRPGRAAPINDAVARARGDYVCVLDDDDFVFGHFVETIVI